jgi:hypothetical protein
MQIFLENWKILLTSVVVLLTGKIYKYDLNVSGIFTILKIWGQNSEDFSGFFIGRTKPSRLDIQMMHIVSQLTSF